MCTPCARSGQRPRRCPHRGRDLVGPHLSTRIQCLRSSVADTTRQMRANHLLSRQPASQKFAFRRLVRTFKGGAPESLVDPLVTTRWRRLRDLRCHAPVSIILTGMILWAWIEPLLPVVPRRADHPGRKRLHPVRAPHRYPVGVPAPGTRVRLRHDRPGGGCGTGIGTGSGSGCTRTCSPNSTPRTRWTGSGR